MAKSDETKPNKFAVFLDSHKGKAFIYLLITTGGSLMPVWGGLLLYMLFSLCINFWIYVDEGQFYLLSAALFTPSCYQRYKNKSGNNTFHSFIFLGSIFLLIVSAILFAGCSIFDLPPNTSTGLTTIPFKLNENFLRFSSLTLFICSLITAFIAQTIEIELSAGGPDSGEVEDARKKDVKDLNKGFDELPAE